MDLAGIFCAQRVPWSTDGEILSAIIVEVKARSDNGTETVTDCTSVEVCACIGCVQQRIDDFSTKEQVGVAGGVRSRGLRTRAR